MTLEPMKISKEQIKELADKTVKLNREVARLRSDVIRLLERIKRNEFTEYKEEKLYLKRSNHPSTSIGEALHDVTVARDAIRGIEYDIRKLDNLLTQIEQDSMGREEMKRLLVDGLEEFD